MIGLGLGVSVHPRSGVSGGGGGNPYSGLTLVLLTHTGDNVPVGLYQDVACTIPALDDGDPVAAWRDELSGSGRTYVQSDEAKQPTLKFVSGSPVVRWDGVDDILISSDGAFGISEAACAASCRISSDTEYAVFDTGTANDGFWRFTDGNGYFGLFRTARINTYPPSMPSTGTHVFSITSADDYEVWVDGVSQGSQAGSFSSGSATSSIGGRRDSLLLFTGDIVGVLVSGDISKRADLETLIPATP